jgi:integrase
MAQIRERLRKNGKKSFFVRIRMKRQPEVTASFDKLTDARLWASSTESAMREGRYIKTKEAQKHSLSDLVDRYIIEVLPGKPNVSKDYTFQLEWWKTQIGDVLLSELTPVLISEYRNLLSKKITFRKTQISHATVNRYLAALSTAISTAINEWGWMEDNILRKVSKLKESRGRVRYLSDEERNRFLSACKESSNSDLYTVVILAMSTGARKNEIWKLSWDKIDLKNRYILLEETKNDEPRSIPLQGHALELMLERSKTRSTETNLVFPSRINPQKNLNFRRPFSVALKAAKIENFRWHDLRHCAASYLVMAGVDMRTVAEILGHKTMQMTQRYTHLSPDHLKDAVAKMNHKIFG